MRYLVTPIFSQKVAQSSGALHFLSSFFIQLEALITKDEVFRAGVLGSIPELLQQNIYVFKYKQKDLCIFFSVGSDQDGEFLLLLDLSFRQERSIPEQVGSARNPKTNSCFNPNLNSAINPRFNSSINPRFNSAINPRFNSSINPRFNSAINPRFNPAFTGPFVYSLDLEREGFIVRANEQAELIFNDSIEFVGFIVDANDKVSIVFDIENNWIGYLVTANENIRLRFNEDGEFTGIVIL
jgi:hypothetical protein